MESQTGVISTVAGCYLDDAIKTGLKEKGHFFLLSNFFSLLLISKEEHVSDQKMV